MNTYGRKCDDLDSFLREHGGLDGLAGELGQHDPSAKLYELPANDHQALPGGIRACDPRQRASRLHQEYLADE